METRVSCLQLPAERVALFGTKQPKFVLVRDFKERFLSLTSMEWVCLTRPAGGFSSRIIGVEKYLSSTNTKVELGTEKRCSIASAFFLARCKRPQTGHKLWQLAGKVYCEYTLLAKVSISLRSMGLSLRSKVYILQLDKYIYFRG